MTTITWACQPLPSGKSVYVATPPGANLTWAMRMAQRLTAAAVPNIIVSETHAADDLPDLEDLLTWQRAAREIATVILYVLPCGSEPGMDFGYDVALGRSVVLCLPHAECAPRVVSLARSHSVPLRAGLTNAASAAASWARWGFPA